MTAVRKNRWMRTTFLHGVVLGGRKSRMPSRGRLPTAVALALALVVPVGLAQAVQAQAAPAGSDRPAVPEYRTSKVVPVHGLGAAAARAHVKSVRAANAAQAARALVEQKATWPTGGTATARLSTKTASMTIGGMPVHVAALHGTASAAGQVRVTTMSRKATDAAGVRGVLFQASADTPGAARLSVDYRAFASAFGGGWAGRLHLVSLPPCLLTTPDKAACRKRTPIDSANEIGAATVNGTVNLPGASPTAGVRPAVFALEADSSGGEDPSGAGNYSATPLSVSSTWSAGTSSGAFTWSYGMRHAAGRAGPSPSISLDVRLRQR